MGKVLIHLWCSPWLQIKKKKAALEKLHFILNKLKCNKPSAFMQSSLADLASFLDFKMCHFLATTLLINDSVCLQME